MHNFSKKDLPWIFRYRVLWHIAFWIIIYFAFSISYGGYGECKYYYEFVVNAILLPGRIIFTYIMVYLLLPKLLLKRKYGYFIVGTIIHALIFGFVMWYTFRNHIKIGDFPTYKHLPLFHLSKILVSSISNYVIVLLAVILKLFKWWFLDQQYKVQIEKEKLESELKYLKAQIHPHFLFNTLNNLYALTLQNSSKASDMVIKLSGLLDYMLYHSNNERVGLQKELTIIEDYIELEKLRYGERLKLNYEVSGSTQGIEIAPLILIPFVENAFKHGASNDRSKPEININVEITNDNLKLKINNTVPKHAQTPKNGSNGIGLENIRRRLELIYTDKHKLDINFKDNYYHVDLCIELD